MIYCDSCIFISKFRPNLDEVINTMNFYGATEVVTEEIAASHLMKDIMAVSLSSPFGTL